MFYVYILKSELNKKIYIGRTSDLRERIKQHLDGKCKTTKRIKSFKIVFYEAFLNKQDAVRRENYLKTTKGKSSIKQIIRNSLEN